MRSSVIACAFLLSAASSSYADTIHIGDYIQMLGSSGNTGGGAFNLDNLSTSAIGDFLTFCIQRTQYIDYSSRFLVKNITNFADDLPNNDPISDETAWIYSSFRLGQLGAFNVNEIQAAIWVLENEWSTQIGNSAALIGLAQAAVNGGYTNHGVQVLNLYYADGVTRAQDQLTFTPTPEPASLLLLGSGIAAVGAARRKRRQRKA